MRRASSIISAESASLSFALLMAKARRSRSSYSSSAALLAPSSSKSSVKAFRPSMRKPPWRTTCRQTVAAQRRGLLIPLPGRTKVRPSPSAAASSGVNGPSATKSPFGSGASQTATKADKAPSGISASSNDRLSPLAISSMASVCGPTRDFNRMRWKFAWASASRAERVTSSASVRRWRIKRSIGATPSSEGENNVR